MSQQLETESGKLNNATWGFVLGAGFGELVCRSPVLQTRSQEFSLESQLLGFIAVTAVMGTAMGITPAARMIRQQIAHQLFETEIALRMSADNFRPDSLRANAVALAANGKIGLDQIDLQYKKLLSQLSSSI